MCCRMFAIDDEVVKKVAKVLCPHYSREAHNCTIYDHRGKVCVNYKCFWLSGMLPEWAKPDKLDIVFDRLVSMGGVVYLVGYVDNFTDKIDKAIYHMNKSGISVLIRSGAEDYKRVYLYQGSLPLNPSMLELAKNTTVPSIDAQMITLPTSIAANSVYGNPPLIIG